MSAFTSCVAAVVLLLQDAPATDALTELAARCGSELEWAQDWDDAAARARREDRLVLVYVRDQRGFAISDAAMIGPFMDEDVVAWVRERCVPLKFDRHADDAPFEDPAVFGLGPLTFGLAVLLTTPSGEVVAQTCLPTTEGVAALLDQTFAKQAAPSDVRDGSDAAALERARAAFERCELDRALAESQRIDDAEAHVLRARIHRARMQGTDALRELDAAREAGAESARIAVLRAEVLLRGGDAVAARGAAQSALEGAASPPASLAAHAHYVAGAAAYVARDPAAGTRHWTELVRDFPTERWAWLAAGVSTSTIARLGGLPQFSWPREDVRRALRRVDDEPLSASAARQAMDDAIAYLIRVQRDDGSWLCGGEVDGIGARASDLTLGVTAIAARACLLDDSPVAKAAVDRVLAWLRAQRELEIADTTAPLFKDYGGWSAAYRLAFAAECIADGRMNADDPFPRGMIEELASRQKPGGGWHYYVSGDATGAASGGSTSFITAAAVLALVRAREVGVDVPNAVLDKALDALDRMRNDNGSYEYWIDMGGPRQHAARRDGSYGRGPICALARFKGGRSSLAELERAVDDFVDHRRILEAQRGKSLMHAGPDGEGCHYVLFDFAGAAAAVAELDAEERDRVREVLLDSILAMRTEDGAFLDFAMIGADYGAGMARIALGALVGE